jgi:hypothetical protein
MTRPRLWAAAAVLAWLAAALYGGIASAKADGYCTTDHYSNTTYVTCTWTDTTGYRHRTVETCYDNTPTCSIKGD